MPRSLFFRKKDMIIKFVSNKFRYKGFKFTIYRLLTHIFFSSKNYRPVSSFWQKHHLSIGVFLSITGKFISHSLSDNKKYHPYTQAKKIVLPTFERFTPLLLIFSATILIVLTFIIYIFDTNTILVSIFAMSTRDKKFWWGS